MDEARMNELKGYEADRTAEAKRIADTFTVEDGKVTISVEQKAEFDKVMGEVKEIRGLISDVRSLDAEEREERGEPTPSVAAALAAAGGVLPESKSLGEAFTESDEFKYLAGGQNGYNMPVPFQVGKADITSLRSKDVYTSMPTGTPGSFGATQRDPIILRQQLQSRVRDLFPAQRTTAAVIEYFKVTGFTNAASPVPERDGSAFGAKPQSGLTFVGEQTSVRTIAHWEAAHRNVLADEPQLQAIINNELLYGLALREDQQILTGAGTGEDLRGILNTPGIQTYDWSDGATDPVPDAKSDAVRRAATLAFLAYYQPTGVVVHPNDWEDIELQKDLNGQYLVAVAIAIGGEKRLWRMPVVDTPAISEGTALVGAFGLGAQLYDREQANIRIAEQHSDFFIRNAIVILAEERLALAVKRPEAFVKVTFDAEPS